MRTRRKGLILAVALSLAVVLSAAMLLGACGPKEVAKGDAVFAYAGSYWYASGIDPATANGGAFGLPNNLVFDSLITKGADAKILPAIAKSWEISEGGKRIDFTLNPGAKFHNGAPVTADDVKYTFQKLIAPESKYNYKGELSRALDSIEVVDQGHLVFHWKTPYALFFDRCLGYMGIFPKEYREKVGDKEFAAHPIGAGPFKLVDFQQDVKIKVEAVEDHYRKPPEVKTLTVLFVAEHTTRMAMVKTGEADIVGGAPVLFTQVKSDPNLKLAWSKYTVVTPLYFCDVAFPDKPSPLLDVRVRKAISYAIDRKGICEKVLQGVPEPWGDLYAPYQPGYDPSIKADPYDPEKAKALLAEAGYPKGFEITFNGAVTAKEQDQAIAANLEAVGIKAKLVLEETGTSATRFSQKKMTGLYDGVAAGMPFWDARHSPAGSLAAYYLKDSIWTYSTTNEIDAKLQQLTAATTDTQMATLATELRKLIVDYYNLTPLWASNVFYIMGPKVKYWEPVSGCTFPSRFEFLKLK